MFTSAAGEPLHPESVSDRFDTSVKRAGLRRISVHRLRHSWATLALINGVHPRVVQQRIGHANIAVTLGIYSHVTAGTDDAAAETVALAVAGGQ